MSQTAPQINMVIVPEDPNTVILFKKHREKFIDLVKAGVFDLDEGRAEINMHNGQVQSVHIDRMTFKRERGTVEGRSS